MVHGFLVESNERAELIPGIAETWETSEDGLTWTLTIRDDVRFHNGELLTVDDVVFSLQDTYGQGAIDNSTIGAIVSLAKITESIEAAGPNTVVVKHTEPVRNFPFVLSSIDANYGGAIIPKAYFEQVGRDGFSANPIGAGSLKVVENRPGEGLVLERFDEHYFKERIPAFNTLNWDLVPESATRVQALLAGQADLIAADLVSQGQITQGGNKIVVSPETAYLRFGLPGCWKPELACHDKRVRQALDLAIDKEAVMGQLYGEAWTNAGWAYVSPSSLGYSEDLDPRPVDVAEAKRLLGEAGFTDPTTFPPLVLNTAVDATVPMLPEFALLVAQQWEQNLGIPTEVRVSDPETLRVRWLGRELDGGVYVQANGARYDGASITRSGYGDIESETRQHEDPALHALVEEAQAAVTPEERDQAYNEAYKVFRDETYELGLGSLGLAWGMGQRVDGWQLWPLTIRPTALWTIQVKE